MSSDGVTPSQWDESSYTPFPAFVDWVPARYDSALVDRYDQQLRALRTRVSEADLDRALEIVNRYAAIDTGAIEGLYQVDRGFTKTVATQTAAWENALRLKGEGVKRAIDDALGAYEYVLDAVTGAVPITEVWIRELHELICRSQNTFSVVTPVGPQDHPLPKGVYKSMPNSPTNLSTGRVHAYAPPAQTPSEMARLIAELRSPEFLAAHPVLQASYSHYAYVAVHPFSDGNGRVARALASVYLYRSPGVPLVVFADQRDRYLDALEAADGGDAAPFVRFIETRTVDAVALLEASLQSDARQADADIAELRSLLEPREVDEQMLAAFDRAAGLARASLHEALRAVGLPETIRTSVVSQGPNSAVPDGWRSLGQRGTFFATLQSTYPRPIQMYPRFEVVERTVGVGAEFAIVDQDGHIGAELWLRDLLPVETESVRLRVELWAEGAARQIVHQLTERLRNSD